MKHLGNTPKINRRILKMNQGGTQTNGPNDKNVDNDAQRFTSER